MTQDAERQSVLCFGGATGNVGQKRQLGPAYEISKRDGSRARPAVSRETVVAFTSDRPLAAAAMANGQLDLRDGRQLTCLDVSQWSQMIASAHLEGNWSNWRSPQSTAPASLHKMFEVDGPIMVDSVCT